jgi:hypothetical protein
VSAKLFLWNKNKPVESTEGLSIEIVDKETGEFVIVGADIGVYYQHMFALSNNNKGEDDDNI